MPRRFGPRVRLRTVELPNGEIVTVKSGLEEKLVLQLYRAGLPVRYEKVKVRYTKPEQASSYTPDFVLPNGIFIEGKGIFTSEDRVKHLRIREQHPHLDVRFVFNRSASALYKGADSTYASWCTKHRFQFADREIPASWLKEKAK